MARPPERMRTAKRPEMKIPVRVRKRRLFAPVDHWWSLPPPDLDVEAGWLRGSGFEVQHNMLEERLLQSEGSTSRSSGVGVPPTPGKTKPGVVLHALVAIFGEHSRVQFIKLSNPICTSVTCPFESRTLRFMSRYSNQPGFVNRFFTRGTSLRGRSRRNEAQRQGERIIEVRCAADDLMAGVHPILQDHQAAQPEPRPEG
jgi:hypothetical protein